MTWQLLVWTTDRDHLLQQLKVHISGREEFLMRLQELEQKMPGYPMHQQLKVGDLTVTLVSDGFITATADVFPTVSEDRFSAVLDAADLPPRDPALPPDGYEIPVYAFIIEDGADVHLVDAGGLGMDPSLGKLKKNMSLAGYQPEQVKSLIASHLHPDHIGGAVIDGKAAFPNAEMIVSKADHGFWTDSNIRNGAPDEVKPFFDMAAASVDAYSDRLKLIGDNEEIAPGITSVALPGHTPGHTGFVISSNNETLLFWADIVHMQYLQFDDPSVSLVFDIDPEQAIATRKKVFDQVATDGLQVIGSHLRFPVLGHVEKAGTSYRFVPST